MSATLNSRLITAFVILNLYLLLEPMVPYPCSNDSHHRVVRDEDAEDPAEELPGRLAGLDGRLRALPEAGVGEAVARTNRGEDPNSEAAALAVFLASSESDGISGKNISAVWDRWQEFPKHKKEIMKSDIYNLRRVKPKDSGYDW